MHSDLAIKSLFTTVLASAALLVTATSPAAAAENGRYYDQIASYWMQAGDTKPFTGRAWSPWRFERRVEYLAETGFKGIGIFHDDLRYVLENEAQGDTREERLQWMADVLESNGIEIVELEFLVSWMLPEDDYRRQAERETRQLLLEAAEVLDAEHIKIGNIFGYPVANEQLKKAFGEICEEAARAGTRIGMEILPPDPNSRTLDQAMSWIRGHDNCGLFLDIWHVNHIDGITYEAVSELEPGDIVAVELNDGFTDIDSPYIGFIEKTVNMRRIPGNGEFDVVGFLQAVQQAGFEGPWGNEILSEEYRRVPMEAAYPRVFRSTEKLLREAEM